MPSIENTNSTSPTGWNVSGPNTRHTALSSRKIYVLETSEESIAAADGVALE